MSTLAERVEELLAAWSDVHGDPANDLAGMELYAAAYRECISDLTAVLVETAARCDHRYQDAPEGSVCIRAAHPHNPNGHQYAGRSVPDGHDLSEAAAERTRG